MALITIPWVFTVGQTIVASNHNQNFSTIVNDYDGNIDSTNISPTANIANNQLAQITAVSKVSGAALTLLTSVPSGAGILPGVNGGVPTGCILMWSGTIATIPSGYVLCNGSNSTPDLRNLFIVGADADDSGVAKSTVTGSALQSSSTGVMPAHTHTVDRNISGAAFGNAAIASSNTATIGATTTSGSTGTNTKVISVFYALALIMKS